LERANSSEAVESLQTPNELTCMQLQAVADHELCIAENIIILVTALSIYRE